MDNPSQLLKTNVLGIELSRTTYDATTSLVTLAATRRQSLTVSALAVHGLMTGVLDSSFGRKLNSLDILTPDGQPVRWAMNLFGAPRLKERVYGPTLMLSICAAAQEKGIGVYLFGSRQPVLDRLAHNLENQFPALKIKGQQADRFRDATEEEDADDISRIKESGAGIVFCGRGCPRQETWCYDHKDKLDCALIAVGAAFDFHAGTLKQAPTWMQNAGLEWLFRFSHEPRRLWRRFVFLNPLFIFAIILQASGMRRFPVRTDENTQGN